MRYVMVVAVAMAALVLGAGCDGDAGESAAPVGSAPVASSNPRSSSAAPPECAAVKALQQQYLPVFTEASAKVLAAVKQGDNAAAIAGMEQQDTAVNEWTAKLEPLLATVSDAGLKDALGTLAGALKRYTTGGGLTSGEVVKAGTAVTTALDKACG